MNPADCNPADHRRYFHDGWMLYKNRQVVKVHAREGVFSISEGLNKAFTEVNPSDLTPFYPEGACINSYQTGIAISRRARQTARRTACLIHYEVSYYPRGRTLSFDRQIMWDLCLPRKYPSLKGAMDKMMRGGQSVAISKDIIIENAGASSLNLFPVLWHSTRVGNLDNGVFVPDYEGSCYTKLTRQSLQELGLQCL